MRQEIHTKQILELIKADQEFDEKLGRWLAEGAGKSSEEDVDSYIAKVKRDIDPGLRTVAASWEKEDEDE